MLAIRWVPVVAGICFWRGKGLKNFEIPPLEKILADEGRKAMCKDMVVVEHFEKILQKRNIRWRRRFERPHLAQTDACCRFDQVGHFILDLLVNKGAVFQRAKSLMRCHISQCENSWLRQSRIPWSENEVWPEIFHTNHKVILTHKSGVMLKNVDFYLVLW